MRAAVKPFAHPEPALVIIDASTAQKNKYHPKMPVLPVDHRIEPQRRSRHYGTIATIALHIWPAEYCNTSTKLRRWHGDSKKFVVDQRKLQIAEMLHGACR
jgi:hypothetical protein